MKGLPDKQKVSELTKRRIEGLRKSHQKSEKRQNRLDQKQKGIDRYRKYRVYYGYVFYLMKKAGRRRHGLDQEENEGG